jgi:hypothetical protein
MKDMREPDAPSQPYGLAEEAHDLRLSRDLAREQLSRTIAERNAERALSGRLAEALRSLTHSVLLITDQTDSGRLDAIERLHRDGAAIESARDTLSAYDSARKER